MMRFAEGGSGSGDEAYLIVEVDHIIFYTDVTVAILYMSC